jgi:hypothetical protein
VAKPEGWGMFERAQPVAALFSMHSVTESFNAAYSANDTPEMPAFFKRRSSRSFGNEKCRFMSAAPASDDGISDSFRDTGKPKKNMHPEVAQHTLESIDDFIREAAGKQNADGTFGKEQFINLKTSCFVIALLLKKDEWKPYRIQLGKAGKALMGTDDKMLLLKTVAIELLRKHKIITGVSAEEYVRELEKRLDAEQYAVFSTFMAGDHSVLKKVIGKASEADTLVISLLKTVLKDDILDYLNDQE